MTALPTGGAYVFHNRNLRATFHPKLWVFDDGADARVIVGSGNLTGGGLFTNYEAGWVADLQLAPDSTGRWASIESALAAWFDCSTGLARKLDAELLARLVQSGRVGPEVFTPEEPTPATAESDHGGEAAADEPWFPSVHVPLPPSATSAGEQQPSSPETAEPEQPATTVPSANAAPVGYLMTLTNTDVGVGQTTAGTQRRSPEIFIPLVSSRDANPAFWGWPHLFVADPHFTGRVDGQGYGKMDRHDVRFRVGGQVVKGTIWYNPVKRDIRIRSEHLRSSGAVGDILRLEAAPTGANYDYLVEFETPGTTTFAYWDALCSTPVRNSPKRWGYY